ncbi:hypothetical protein OG894_45235 (plasmid) [Streptomyces sp. NBC_01724]|uniref:hypothetical protein n=1 Tax=Streptomyces sp. NBC_01724 TaxID=2975922 RepID=UPI002E3737B2|nr:hypothetical protein [Streptomyces sp. NBC_01724]
MKELQNAGQIIDPRAAQVERLKKENDELRKRIAVRDEELTELTEFKTLAISRLAAQHDEIERLHKQATSGENVRRLPASRNGTAPYGSCS